MAARTYSHADLRDPSPLWRALRAVIIVFAVVQLVQMTYEAAELALGADFAAENLAFALVMLLVFVISIASFVIAAVLTCRLTYRLMRNLHAWQAPVELMAPAWAAGWHFIPFASLWMPLRAVRQMQKGADALLKDIPSAESSQTGFWWGAWIVGNILGNISFRLLTSSGGFDGVPTDLGLYRASNVTGIASSLLLAIACPLMIDVFGKLVDAQARIQAQFAPPSAQPSAA